MKNLSKIILFLFVVFGYDSFSQVNPKQDLIVSSSTVLNMTFVPTSSFEVKTHSIFKDLNYDTFFEIKFSGIFFVLF